MQDLGGNLVVIYHRIMQENCKPFKGDTTDILKQDWVKRQNGDTKPFGVGVTKTDVQTMR